MFLDNYLGGENEFPMHRFLAIDAAPCEPGLSRSYSLSAKRMASLIFAITSAGS
jgi:hypothetical protein